jgi:SAM-dependent methyltransferase
MYTLDRFGWPGLARTYLGAFGLDRGAADDRWNEAYVRSRRGLARRRRRLEGFRIDRAARILDFGCGDGINARLLMEMGCSHVVCLDYSLALLRAGRPPRAVSADGYAAPFASGIFDAVLVDGVLHHLSPTRALAEIARLLAPGGRLYLVEPAPSPMRSLLDLATLSPPGRLSAMLRARRQSLAGEWGTYKDWLRRCKDLPVWLAEAGLTRRLYRRTPLNVLAVAERAPAATETTDGRHSLRSGH